MAAKPAAVKKPCIVLLQTQYIHPAYELTAETVIQNF